MRRVSSGCRFPSRRSKSPGHITGVVAEAASRQVAYLLLLAGHLLGSKNIAVPISAVTRVDAGILLDIARQDVRHLPPVDLQ